MRAVTHMTKSGLAYYIIRDVTKNGKRSTETLKDLGTEEEIKEKYHCDDVKAWANEQAQKMSEDDGGRKVLVPYTPSRQIGMNEVNAYDIGYLFLQKIYYSLRIDLICSHISKRYSFKYDLNDIMMKLIYERILHPSSKLSTYQQSRSLLEGPSFSYHDVPRALSVMAKEFDTIQAELYDYSKKVIPRNTNVLYYDCTNFFFEIDQGDDISNEDADRLNIAARKHGASKEHRPLPIVQMGLFMDYTGIPLAICLNRGNRNEQTTLIPLEEKIMSDFEISRFVICTDAGLSSEDNRKFNNFGERSFVTTVSIKDKKIPKKLQDWCLDPTGWYLDGSAETYDIRHLEDTPGDAEKNRERIFYKSKLIEGYDEKRDITFNQTLFVTYSLKYRDYTKHLREAQIERASSAIEQGPSKIEKNSANDYKRFIKKEAKVVKTKDSKKKEAEDDSKARIEYSLDTEAIENEARFDGFYALETNLDDGIADILSVVKGRWEIEESFRIMKSDFDARPVYLSRSDRIKAHFLTCFIALLVYRILERKLDNKYTCESILKELRGMKMTKAKDIGYIPSYTRTSLTDDLHNMAGFRTDYEITRSKAMRGVIRKSKERLQSDK
ncbi:MAG: IS1634 family transposase [Butyrivibrio sp.]|nr:IS1634 family transposase [Butyrivibrio sp.]